MKSDGFSGMSYWEWIVREWEEIFWLENGWRPKKYSGVHRESTIKLWDMQYLTLGRSYIKTLDRSEGDRVSVNKHTPHFRDIIENIASYD
jgi:hypothetical protein